MGIFVNPGNEHFKAMLRNQIYVDKTMMIAELNKRLNSLDNYMCISRPRRFGKSVAAGMLTAYYSKGCDSRDLFKNLNISRDPSYSEHLNKLNVILVDLKNFFRRDSDNSRIMETISVEIIKELKTEFPNVEFSSDKHLSNAILNVYSQTGEKFVFIMDEYDLLVREKVPKSELDSFIVFLESLFKNSTLRPAFNLAYLTGILPIVRDKIQSKMNEFDEYTIINSRILAPYIGITYDECLGLCNDFDMDFDECKRWYDGYVVNKKEIFATKSVVQSMADGEYDSYWSNTGSYEAVSNYIDLNFDGVFDDVKLMLAGHSVDVNVLSYLNTMTDFHCKDDVFTYLIHLGYLGYNKDTKTCFIPNYEVRLQWELAVGKASHFKPIADSIQESQELLERTIEGDSDFVAEALDKAHLSLCHPLKYNNEHAFQVAMVMAYYTARNKYYVVQELPTGKGFADIALIPFEPGCPAIIIELKVDGSAGMALSQIRDQKYDTIFHNYRGEVIFAGVNYNKATKLHQCRIDRLVR